MLLQAKQGYQLFQAGVDKLHRFRDAPQVVRYTCDLCATLLAPLLAAEALATRRRAHLLVSAALRLARATVRECEALLPAAEGEAEVSWAEWLVCRTEGASKVEKLREMQHKLSSAALALQLALATVSVSLPHGYAASPFCYVREAFDEAAQRYVEVEMGRERKVLLCGGELWQRGILVSGGAHSDAMKKLFECRVSLRSDSLPEEEEGEEGEEEEEEEEEEEGGGGEEEAKGSGLGRAAASEKLSLLFEEWRADGEACEERRVPLEHSVRFRRFWSRELLHDGACDEFVDVVGEEALCYEVCPAVGSGAAKLVLLFQCGEALPAESFEAVVFMALASRQQSGRALTLAEVYDSPGTARWAQFIEMFQAVVGTLEGVPLVRKATARAQRGGHTQEGLVTPLRGLSMAQSPLAAEAK
ncbi:hypothetical protein AB1Y20_016002 [Prymnesium parvum]|uniref:Uncharacterized protein n=1 Tax=Prymnesium parvum TaxID=97485 RepID=A0AB34INN1_PRYPA